jgi:hypothetical protein
MSTCNACQSSKERPNSGAYRFQCVECMARLIKSARPLRRLQEGHIAALERFHGPAWALIWPEVQKLLKG